MPISHLSPSSFALYRWCPARWEARYVDGLYEPATQEMAFGTAVHAGIEAHHLGQDGPVAFLKKWKAAAQFSSSLSQRGVQLVEAVASLRLAGVPELPLQLSLEPAIPLPIIGYADLWSAEHGTIHDFKTTARWTEASEHRARFQVAVYCESFCTQHGVWPTFTFVVLPRVGPLRVQVVQSKMHADQAETVLEECLAIWESIQAGAFGCTCGTCEGGKS